VRPLLWFVDVLKEMPRTCVRPLRLGYAGSQKSHGPTAEGAGARASLPGIDAGAGRRFIFPVIVLIRRSRTTLKVWQKSCKSPAFNGYNSPAYTLPQNWKDGRMGFSRTPSMIKIWQPGAKNGRISAAGYASCIMGFRR